MSTEDDDLEFIEQLNLAQQAEYDLANMVKKLKLEQKALYYKLMEVKAMLIEGKTIAAFMQLNSIVEQERNKVNLYA